MLKFLAFIALLAFAAPASAQDRGGAGCGQYGEVTYLVDSRGPSHAATVGGSLCWVHEILDMPLEFGAYGYSDLLTSQDKSFGPVNGTFTEANLWFETPLWGLTVHAEVDVLTGPFSATVYRFGIGRRWNLWGGVLRVNVSPFTIGDEFGKAQINSFAYFPAPDWLPLHERVSFAWFFDVNLAPRRIVFAPQVAVRVLGDLHAVCEYRRGEFDVEKNAIACGVSFRPRVTT